MHKLTKNQWIIVLVFALLIPVTIFFVSYHERPVTSAPVIMEELNESLNIQQWTFPDGPRIYVVERDAQPIVDIKLIFDAGSARDNIPGTSYLLAKMLTKGTEKFTANEIAERLESVGADLHVYADQDKLTLSCRTLSDSAALKLVIPVLQELIQHPTFEPEAFSAVKNQLSVRLKREAEEPRPLAEKAFLEQLYGSHPYAHPVQGTKESLDSLTSDTLKSFHSTQFSPQNMTVVVVGDTDSGSVDSWVKQLVEGLPTADKLSPIDKVETIAAGTERHVSLDSAQTHIRFGLPLQTADDQDRYALKIAEQVIGGGFNSRLYNNVRRDGGLAYSVSASSNAWSSEGPFSIRLETRAEKAQDAVEKVQQVVKTFIEKGPTTEEVELAKRSVKGQLSLMFSSNQWIAAHVEDMAFYDKPLDFFEEYARKLDEVTAEDVVRVMQKRAPIENWNLLTVGPA